MELRHLRYFLAVAETLNFTEAAARLGISQPPLSQQIADLENELHVKLFNRHNRHVELSLAGRAFRRHAESMLIQTRNAIEEVRSIGKGSAGMINLATTSSVLNSGLAVRVANFRKLNHDVAIVIHESSPREQIERVLDRRIDVCFLRFAPDVQNLSVKKVWKEKVGLIVPTSHRLSGRKRVRLIDLANEDFVFYRKNDSGFASHLYSACIESGFSPRVVQEVTEAFSLSSLVAAGLGIGFVPEFFAKLQNVHLLTIQDASPNADVYALIHNSANPVTKSFVESVCR